MMDTRPLFSCVALIYLLLAPINVFAFDAATDLRFMLDKIIENHPGVYNKADPNFNTFLNQTYSTYQTGLLKISASSEQEKYLDGFWKSFNDTHLRIRWDQEQHPKKVKARVFTARNITPNITWISIPTFNIHQNENDSFNKMVKALSSLGNKQAIIFDLRGNQGGNSLYGSQIIDALFGKSYAEFNREKLNAGVTVDWRVSPDNLSFLKNVNKEKTNKLPQFIIDGMENKLKLGENLYSEPASSQQKILAQNPEAPNLVHAKIIVITDAKNVSAALDFIDELKANYPILLIGKQTGSDRLYMDIRTVRLPSHRGYLSFPMKVYRNRKRGDNVPYVPDIYYDGDLSDTEKLEKFVLSKL